MKTVVTFLAITLLVGSLSGCASIVNGRYDKVAIHSEPSDARIRIVNQWGDIAYIGNTPALVPLKTGAGYLIGSDYTITFEKEGYAKSTVMIKRSMNTLWVFNIYPWGPYGWAIDSGTGAMWNLEDTVQVKLRPLPSSESLKRTDGPPVISLYDIPTSLRSRPVRID